MDFGDGHNWEKTNLVSNKDGSDSMECSECHAKGNRPFCANYVRVVKGKKICLPPCPATKMPTKPSPATENRAARIAAAGVVEKTGRKAATWRPGGHKEVATFGGKTGTVHIHLIKGRTYKYLHYWENGKSKSMSMGTCDEDGQAREKIRPTTKPKPSREMLERLDQNDAADGAQKALVQRMRDDRIKEEADGLEQKDRRQEFSRKGPTTLQKKQAVAAKREADEIVSKIDQALEKKRKCNCGNQVKFREVIQTRCNVCNTFANRKTGFCRKCNKIQPTTQRTAVQCGACNKYLA